jgi:hypothetical protein
MSVAIGEIVVEFGLDIARFRAAANEARGVAANIARGVAGAFNVAGGALGGLISGLTSFKGLLATDTRAQHRRTK